MIHLKLKERYLNANLGGLYTKQPQLRVSKPFEVFFSRCFRQLLRWSAFCLVSSCESRSITFFAKHIVSMFRNRFKVFHPFLYSTLLKHVHHLEPYFDPMTRCTSLPRGQVMNLVGCTEPLVSSRRARCSLWRSAKRCCCRSKCLAFGCFYHTLTRLLCQFLFRTNNLTNLRHVGKTGKIEKTSLNTICTAEIT